MSWRCRATPPRDPGAGASRLSAPSRTAGPTWCARALARLPRARPSSPLPSGSSLTSSRTGRRYPPPTSCIHGGRGAHDEGIEIQHLWITCPICPRPVDNHLLRSPWNKYCATLVRRVSVIGTSGSGKSTLGRELASAIGGPFLGLDSVFHQPRWAPPPP